MRKVLTLDIDVTDFHNHGDLRLANPLTGLGKFGSDHIAVGDTGEIKDPDGKVIGHYSVKDC